MSEQLALPLLPPAPPPRERPESWLELIDLAACESTGGWTPEREARYQAAIADAQRRWAAWPRGRATRK